jgi:glycosyltransferase involved in cell wall biosynthesis
MQITYHHYMSRTGRPPKQHRVSDDYVIVSPPVDALTSGRIDVENLPKVSFCIPTLNNEKTIGSCLKSIVSQDYPNIEIVVVDGGSSDRTVEIVRTYTDAVFLDEGTLGSARQTSIDHSSGEVLAIFDSDIVIPHSGWLRNAIQYFNCSERVSTVWPAVVAPANASLTARLYANIWHVTFQDRILKHRGYVGGGNALIWKQSMKEIGGIDRSIHWGEDFDWAKRLKDRGYQVVPIKDALCHNTMTSLREFVKKQFVGADTFTKNDFATTGLSKSNLLYEQFVLGPEGMARGLLREGDRSWVLYPLFVLVRVVAYGSAYLQGVLQ